MSSQELESIEPVGVDGTASSMWDDYWRKILTNPETQFWRTGSAESSCAVAAYLKTQLSRLFPLRSSVRVLVPLCGDDPVSVHLFRMGHSILAVDINSDCLALLRDAVAPDPDSWNLTQLTHFKLWQLRKCHDGPQFTVLQGSIFDLADPELAVAAGNMNFDVLYDRAAFGAILPRTRAQYGKLMRSLLNESALIYLEAKFGTGENAETAGPPYHVSQSCLQSAFHLEFTLLDPLYNKKTDQPDRRDQFWQVEIEL